MFNLDEAIIGWRRQMLAARIPSPVPLEELENHLRDDVEQHMRSGLTAEQAFQAAVQRIGHAAEIQREFGKIAKPKPGLRRKLVRTFCVAFAGFCFIVAVPLMLVLSSCVSGNVSRHMKLLEEAGQYTHQLKESGHLPGVAKDDHAMIHVRSSEGDFNLIGHFNKANDAYPLLFVADVSKKDDTSKLPLFQYRLTKKDESSGWQLDAARMIDEKGQEIDLTNPPASPK
jgi:hypothetical protein